MIENIYNTETQINEVENRLITIAIMSKNSNFFPNLKGIKLNQKKDEDKNLYIIQIKIIFQKFDFNFSDFLKKYSRNNKNNLLECWKIYYKVIIGIEYLSNIDLRIEDLDIKDL